MYMDLKYLDKKWDRGAGEQHQRHGDSHQSQDQPLEAGRDKAGEQDQQASCRALLWWSYAWTHPGGWDLEGDYSQAHWEAGSFQVKLKIMFNSFLTLVN